MLLQRIFLKQGLNPCLLRLLHCRRNLYPTEPPGKPLSYSSSFNDKMSPYYLTEETLGGKQPACLCRRHKICGLDPWVGKMPLRRVWQPTPVFLPGESHRQRSLVGYSPQGHKESNRTEHLCSKVNFCKLINSSMPLFLHR